MTMYCALLEESVEEGYYQTEHLKLEDGETLALDWNEMPSKETQSPILIILHGLSGSSINNYIQSTIDHLKKSSTKYHCVVVNARGCGKLPISTAKLFSAGYTDDLKFIINYIHQKYPSAPLFGLGFSLGANILTKYLGEMGHQTPLSAAFTVGNPFDLHKCNQILENSFVGKYLYLPGLLKGLRELYLRNIQQLSIFEPNLDQWKNVADFDRDIVIKCHNFATVEDYHQQSSCNQFIHQIQTPTLFLNALDDPISSIDLIPFKDVEQNPYCFLVTSNFGGHLGYYEGFQNPRPWFVNLIGDYFNEMNQVYKLIESEVN